MKSFTSKFIAPLLIISLLPMIGAFCFPLMENDAESHSQEVSMFSDEQDACFSEMAIDLNTPVLQSSPVASNHSHSLLPCCQSGGQADTANLFNLNRLDLAVMAILFVTSDFGPADYSSIIYHSPDISPPGLIALQTTVLRI